MNIPLGEPQEWFSYWLYQDRIHPVKILAYNSDDDRIIIEDGSSRPRETAHYIYHPDQTVCVDFAKNHAERDLRLAQFKLATANAAIKSVKNL